MASCEIPQAFDISLQFNVWLPNLGGTTLYLTKVAECSWHLIPTLIHSLFSLFSYLSLSGHLYQVQQACTFYSKQNVTHNTHCGFYQTHKTFKYLLPRLFSYGSVLKGKSEIKFQSLVTPRLCFYVTEDLKRKRN